VVNEDVFENFDQDGLRLLRKKLIAKTRGIIPSSVRTHAASKYSYGTSTRRIAHIVGFDAVLVPVALSASFCFSFSGVTM